jgi:GYF domain 2
MEPSRWYVRLANETIGPVTDAEFHELVQKGGIGPRTPVSSDRETWVPAHNIPGFASRLMNSPLIPTSRAATPIARKAGFILLFGIAAGIVGVAVSDWLGTGLFATCGAIFGALLGAFWPVISRPAHRDQPTNQN